MIPRGSPVQRFRLLHQTTPLRSWFQYFTLTLSSAGNPGGYEQNFSYSSEQWSFHPCWEGFLRGLYYTAITGSIYIYIYIHIISSYGNPYSPTRLSNGGFPSQLFETILFQLWGLWLGRFYTSRIGVNKCSTKTCTENNKNLRWKLTMEAWHPFFKSLLFKISGNSGLLFFEWQVISNITLTWILVFFQHGQGSRT